MKSLYEKYKNKFFYAIDGIKFGLLHDRSIQVHCMIAFGVIMLGIFLKFNMVEWLIIIFCIGLVISFEYLNTALEHIVDFISPDYHKEAKIIKDIGAGVVVIMALVSFIIGIVIVYHKLC